MKIRGQGALKEQRLGDDHRNTRQAGSGDNGGVTGFQPGTDRRIDQTPHREGPNQDHTQYMVLPI